MPDTNTSNQTTNNDTQNNGNENNQEQQNNSSSKQVVVACDTNTGKDQEYQDTVCMMVEQAGYQVEKLPIGPNEYATYSYDSKAKGKLGIYLIAAGLTSIADAYEGNTSFDYNYFGIRDDASDGLSSMEDFNTKPISKDWHGDCTPAICNELQGKNYQEINQIVGSKCQAVFGVGPEELAKNLVAALGGQVSGGVSGNTSSGGTAVKIPDVTFYGLIKQIIGATDGLFVVANNMAYLLSFKDMFSYRIENDEDIPIIEPSDVINNTLTKNWTTAGYYNSVEVTYAEGTLKYGHDTLIKQYGENTFYYDCPEDDYETAKAKAQALLTAHVRDYSTDVELQVFYDPNITAGSWVKLRKSITQISGKTRKEIQQEAIKDKKKKVETKRKGINITNITEEIVKKDGINKKIRHLTDEKGEKIDIEEEQSDYDIFFVQSYNCKWDKYNSLIMNLHLKYGPDTPDDPISASVGGMGGGGSASGLAGAVGGQSADINEFVKKCIGNEATERGRAEKVHECLRQIIRYDYYECSHYHSPSECMQNAGHLNCADTSRLTVACMKAAGLQAQVVHGPNHFWTEVQIDGQAVESDLTANTGQMSRRNLGEVYDNLSKDADNGDEPSC